MKKWVTLVMAVFMLVPVPGHAITVDEKKAATSGEVRPLVSGYPCDYLCEADTVDGMHGWEFVWDNSGDVGDLDINALGLSPSKIFGTAWTGLNDGAYSGLDADTVDGVQPWTPNNDGPYSGLDADRLDGYSSNAFVAWPVMNSDIRDKSIAIKKIKGLTAKLRALEARIAVLEAR